MKAPLFRRSIDISAFGFLSGRKASFVLFCSRTLLENGAKKSRPASEYCCRPVVMHRAKYAGSLHERRNSGHCRISFVPGLRLFRSVLSALMAKPAGTYEYACRYVLSGTIRRVPDQKSADQTLFFVRMRALHIRASDPGLRPGVRSFPDGTNTVTVVPPPARGPTERVPEHISSSRSRTLERPIWASLSSRDGGA